MAPVEERALHFTHPNCRLTEMNSDTDFICDGCKTIGSGTRFSCKPCSFDLHNYCANAPSTLSSFMDPHKLPLVVHKPLPIENRCCNICLNPIEGLVYQCRACDLDVHPGCTRFPQYIDLAVDKKHYLELEHSSPQQCNVCSDTCVGMRYACRACNVDVHARCITGWKPRPDPNHTSGSSSGSGGDGISRALEIGIKFLTIVDKVTNGIDLVDSIIDNLDDNQQ